VKNWKKCKKVIFLENALISGKKIYDLLPQKKIPFLQNYFADPENGHFKMSKIDMAKIVLRKWIFWIL
jgi:hypothetical protein